MEEHRYKVKQKLYLSEQTDGSVPNTLVVATVEVVKPRVAAAEHINSFSYENRSPFVRKTKTIIHPGEVNRIRELPQAQNILATHTDSPEVFIWNVDTQPNRSPKDGKEGLSLKKPSRPDLVLVGHTSEASYALAMGQTTPSVLSGGQDNMVILWNLEDQMTTLQDSTQKVDKKREKGPSLNPRGKFIGHKETVEDVQFRPDSTHEFCSVGDDSQLLLWDTRVGEEAVTSVKGEHMVDLHCVDWNSNDQNLILTGAADGQVKLYDRRNLGTNGDSTAIHTFEGHSEPVLCVQWCPDQTSVFGSCAEDNLVNVWDSAKVVPNKSLGKGVEEEPETGLIFKHIGHRDKVVDFHWNPIDPWTIASVSVENLSKGGSSLQMWRINDLIYRPEEEALNELEKHRDFILT